MRLEDIVPAMKKELKRMGFEVVDTSDHGYRGELSRVATGCSLMTVYKIVVPHNPVSPIYFSCKFGNVNGKGYVASMTLSPFEILDFEVSSGMAMGGIIKHYFNQVKERSQIEILKLMEL